MANKYAHLREKAIKLRTEQRMTLEEIVERLALPKGTIYYWIKDIPIPRTERQKQHLGQKLGTKAMQEKYARLRESAYRAGYEEAEELLTSNLKLRDFVLLYIGEGSKRNRNQVDLCNSDPRIIKLANEIVMSLSQNKVYYQLQIHVDHDEYELRCFWGNLLHTNPDDIKIIRKSNSGQLSGRQFRSIYGVLSVRTSDTYFRSRLQAWMDFIKSQW